MEPLFDYQGRTLAIGTGASTNAVVDGLLRMHAAKQFARPITLYIVGGANDTVPLQGVEALLLVGVLRTIRSQTRTVGLGLLRGWQPLLLAAGTAGQRCLLPQTLVSLGPLEWQGLPLAQNPIGLQPSPPESAYHQTERLLQKQLRQLLSELKLPAKLFGTDRFLTAHDAVKHRLADHVVERIVTPELAPSIRPVSHEPHL